MAIETGGEFHLKICTPKGVFLEDQVSEVTLPSAYHGEIGVLPGHAAYTGLLGVGVLEYVSKSRKGPERVVISGGFTSFENNTLLVLSDSADNRDSVNLDTYAVQRQELGETLESQIVGSVEWTRAKAELDRIEAIDELISH
ncbi:MAG: F0F1 ATP synthase subunit epsilon [Bdellovibrionales bacterium]|nr:F0F1 ATP synthase subunit epsilon [Bdellovibrionales bacterium]